MTEAPFYKILGMILPAIAGAFVSMRYVPKDAGNGNKWFSFACSILIAHFVGRGLAQHFGLVGYMETGVIFTTGMFGLTVVSHVVSEVPKIFSDLRKKWFGGGR